MLRINTTVFQGMFDLSKFMIGSGSDGEHESGESGPIQRLKKGPSDTSNFQFQGQESSPGPEQDSDWSDGEDASGVVKHHRKTEKMDPERNIQIPSNWSDDGDESNLIEKKETLIMSQRSDESPVWSDDGLQSWISNKSPKQITPVKIPVCLTDSEGDNKSKINQFETSKKILGKAKTTSEEISDDSYKLIQPIVRLSNNQQTISPFSSPEKEDLLIPFKRLAKQDPKPKKLTTMFKSNIDKRIERLRRKVEDVEVPEALTDSDYTDVETSDSDYSDSLEFGKKRKNKTDNLKSSVLKERLKKSNLKNMVSRLKEQKKNQRELINNLIFRKREVDKNLIIIQTLMKQSHLKCELTEGQLKTVKCLKGNLMEDIDNQNSMILDKINEVNEIKIKLKEIQIENKYLLEKIERNSNHDNDNRILSLDEDMIKIKIDEAILQKDNEFKSKIIEHEVAHLEKEKIWEKNQFDKLQIKEKEYNIQIQKLKADQKATLSIMESEVTDKNLELKYERESNDHLRSSITCLETETISLKEKLEECQSQIKLLEDNIDEKIQEISELQTHAKNKETVESLKAQFSHMAETYEKKIERLEEDIKTNTEKLSKEFNFNTINLREKDELITHLKKDLGLIRKDYEERWKLRDDQFLSEKEDLLKRINTMLASKLEDEEKISNLEKEKESKSKQILNNNMISGELECKTRECEDLKEEVENLKKYIGIQQDENLVGKAKIDIRLVVIVFVIIQ